MKNKRLDEYTINMILLIIFTGVLIILERIFSISLEGFFYALLPTILLILFYVLFHRRTTTFEKSVKKLLETHIPNIVYIDDSEAIKAEFIKAINDTEKYIMTTGGRSRIREYLSVIERNLEEKGIEYYRILSGRKISNELYDHLLKIIERDGIYVSYTTQELTPTLLLTEKVAFIGLPDPIPGEFRTCLKIPDEKIIDKLGKYIRIWYAKSTKLSNKDELEKIERD